jgi:K(+)-stimulated pyrophosphate-energized sodium pump
MSALLAAQAVDLSSSNTTLVIVVGVIAIFAVAIAMVFRGQVLAANDGTESMKTIAVAVQEGASAYLNR